MTDAEYDVFASELTALCRQFGISVMIHEEDIVLAAGFGPVTRYVVAHDILGGKAIKILHAVLDES